MAGSKAMPSAAQRAVTIASGAARTSGPRSCASSPWRCCAAPTTWRHGLSRDVGSLRGVLVLQLLVGGAQARGDRPRQRAGEVAPVEAADRGQAAEGAGDEGLVGLGHV